MAEAMIQCTCCGSFWGKQENKCRNCGEPLVGKTRIGQPNYRENKAERGIGQPTAQPLGTVRKRATGTPVKSMKATR